jgi:MFS family permease
MFQSLQIDQFRILWIGMLFSMAAIQMNIIARAWLAYDISGLGFAIGLVAISRGIPQLICSPFGGVAADRIEKRKLLVIAQSILVGVSLMTAILVHAGIVQIWHLMLLGVIQGSAAPFMMPTRTALMSDLVGERKLPNAIALDSTGRNLNRVMAPAIAGLLLAWSPAIAFYVITLLYAVAVMMMLRLPESNPEDGESDGVLADAAYGFRYIRQQPALIMLIGLAFFMVMLGMPFQQLLPVFQSDVFNVGPSQLGFMYTAVGIGAIVASLAVAYLSESRRKILILIGSGAGFGVSLLLFAVSGVYLLALGFLILVGFMSQAFMTMNKTLIMLNTDKKLYGRVMSVYQMAFSLMPLALLPMGLLVDSIGPSITVAAAGLILLAITSIGGLIQIKRRDTAIASAPAGLD